MIRSVPHAASFLIALGAVSAPAVAQTPVPYRLSQASSYVYGCQPPCLCPLFLVDKLGGTFELSLVGPSPGGALFDVLNVDWRLDFGGQVVHVTGMGTYELGGVIGQHRLKLDLSFDGAPPRAFDSGMMPGGGLFPDLSIQVALNGFYCFDEVFDVQASPLTVGTPYCTSTTNSSGGPATIRAFGSTAVADDDLTLVAAGCPPNKAGVFLFAANQAQTPFGDGNLCLATPLARIPPVVVTNSLGTAFLDLELALPPLAGKVLPGTTWSFQLVFRDPPGGPAGFNLTDGLRIDFH